MKKILIVCISVFVLSGIFAKNSFSEDVSSSSTQAKKTSADGEQVINIVNKNGQIIRHMQTQEEIDDWQMEVKCEEKNESSIMLVGMPKNKTEAFEDALKKDSNRRIAECIGEGYRKKGKLDKAAEYYGKAINLSKTALNAFLSHKALAEIYEQKQQYRLAIQQLDWLIARSNNDAKKELFDKKNNLLKQVEKE
jgi:tetratricopeptide (TPR) repeat protein